MQIYKLYSDGNYFPKAKKSGFGGYIESQNGEVLVEYTEQIKESKYLYNFELLGIIRGLQLAKNKNIEHIISYCDDKNIVIKLKEIFEKNNYNISPNLKVELFDEIIELSKLFKSIRFEYIPRDQNKYADSLSRRYAALMEENFLRKYNAELDYSQKKFENGIKPNKRIFFCHPSIIRNSHKINPYLVASIRNKRIRKLSREQQNFEYSYLFNEIFSKNGQMFIRCFYYDKKQQLKKVFEKIFDVSESHTTHFCDFLSDNLKILKEKNNVRNIWISSNYRAINVFFEQKRKLPNEQWENFLNVYKSLNGFDKVFFHNLPFEHQFSPEIVLTENAKKKLDKEILNLDELIVRLSENISDKEKNKYFGAIIRHQLRNYKAKLERELEKIEIYEIINETVASLIAKGCTNLPIKQKLNY